MNISLLHHQGRKKMVAMFSFISKGNSYLKKRNSLLGVEKVVSNVPTHKIVAHEHQREERTFY